MLPLLGKLDAAGAVEPTAVVSRNASAICAFRPIMPTSGFCPSSPEARAAPPKIDTAMLP